jgi:hypothetical protein
VQRKKSININIEERKRRISERDVGMDKVGFGTEIFLSIEQKKGIGREELR